MPRLEVNIHQIETLIDQLPDATRIKLVKRLESKTLPSRWKAFLLKIDRLQKKYPVSQKEIRKTVEQVRKDLYERSGR